MTSTASPWFVRFRPVAAPRARLFCFPYAGGTSRTYARWASIVPSDIEVCAVELPGRGTRIRHRPLFTNMSSLIEDLSTALERESDLPFLFFGHSLGALVAFLCTRRLRERGSRIAEHLFVSARAAPHASNPDACVASMDDPAFVSHLRKRGGMAPQILAEPELMSLLLPIIRADFVLLDSYAYVDAPPLPCPITAWGGTQDDCVKPMALSEWGMHTTGQFQVELFEGGHFFLDQPAVLERLARALESYGRPRR
jgi:medium-chain acyl-[acyl-carrier-protein] hydrolase